MEKNLFQVFFFHFHFFFLAQKVGTGAQKSGGAAALPAPPPPRSLCFHCVFSHDLSFENGSMIFFLTDDLIKLQRKHCNGFSSLIGCLHCITV